MSAIATAQSRRSGPASDAIVLDSTALNARSGTGAGRAESSGRIYLLQQHKVIADIACTKNQCNKRFLKKNCRMC